MELVLIVPCLFFSFGTITSTKAIIDQTTNKCKGEREYLYGFALNNVVFVIYVFIRYTLSYIENNKPTAYGVFKTNL